MGNSVMPGLRLVLLALLAIPLVSLTLPATAVAQTAGPQALHSTANVESLYWNSATPPPADAAWQPETLPYNTRTEVSLTHINAADSSYVWFRFPLEAPKNAEMQGLYFWRFNLAIAVYFNGVELASSPQTPGLHTMSWNHPLLVAIQPATWQAGVNEVMVRLSRSPWGGNFAPVVYGDMAALVPLWEARMLRQVEFNEILLAFGLGLTLMSLALWVARRRDTIYLWFGAMCFFWSIITSHLVILQNPIPYAHWLPLVHAAIDASIFCMYGFIGRLIQNVKMPRREHLFLGWTLCAASAHFFIPLEYFLFVAYSLHLVGIVCLAVIVLRVGKLALLEHDTPAVVVSLALAIQIILFAHNYYLMIFSSTAAWEGNMFYAHFGIPLLFLVFIGTLLWRFHGALKIAENVNRELESKVAASRLMIERSFEERRVLELRQTAEQERLNIYRELHDDVGSKLLSIVHAEQDSQLSAMARSALESLRHAVSRANHPDQLLHVFLADIREETELRLRGSGHRVSWQQTLPEEPRIVPSRIAFTLNRILKEVVSNIIRHASADHVDIRIDIDDNLSLFSVRDNGRGFDQQGPMGNGIRNIQSRAQEIAATAQWQTSFGQGTQFSVGVPSRLPLATQDAATTLQEAP